MEDQFDIGAQVQVSDLMSPFYKWSGRVKEQIEKDGNDHVAWPLYRIEFDENGIGLSLTFSGSQLRTF